MTVYGAASDPAIDSSAGLAIRRGSLPTIHALDPPRRDAPRNLDSRTVTLIRVSWAKSEIRLGVAFERRLARLRDEPLAEPPTRRCSIRARAHPRAEVEFERA